MPGPEFALAAAVERINDISEEVARAAYSELLADYRERRQWLKRHGVSLG